MRHLLIEKQILLHRGLPLDSLRDSTAALAVAMLLAGCANQAGDSGTEDGPVSAYAATREQSGDPTEFRPVSADHRGTLTPATGIANAIAGKTLVIVQPWVNLDGYELREGPIYFRSDGLADSSEWINTKWSIDSSEKLCLNGQGTNYCFKAFEDDAGQAYLMRSSDRLLSKVASIEDGDSRNVKALYERNMQVKQAQAEFSGILVGAVVNAVLGGFGGGSGGGGGGTCPNGLPSQNGYCPETGGYVPSVPESPSYTPPIGGDGGLYGNGPQHGTSYAW